MQYKPHDYQQYAINYILGHPIAAVILGMGLGKTSITLTAIEQLMYDSFEVSKVLVVAPLRVARNTWSEEIHKWEHLKHLRHSIVLGTAADRKKALAADADIYVINRENLQWLVEQSGVPFDFDMVVLDELSSFKNWNSKRFKAFMKVRPKVKRVIGLTGTPSSNGLMDLFAEFKCLDMGERLGRFISQYRVNYFVPDQMNGQIVYSYRLRKGAEEQIYNKISDITISMKALDHLKMPELISNEYPVYMSEAEGKMYTDMEEDLFIPLKKGEITAANAVALSGKLLQMANGAVYADNGEEVLIHNKKLDAPSGTAVMIANGVKEVLPDSEYIYGRHGRSDKRSSNEIGIHAIRGGTIVGEHTTIFAGHDEVVEIKHSAQSKDIFAKGAIAAAKFLVKQEAGYYNMNNMLN